MPSHDLLLHFQDHLELERRWRVSGNHYRRTAAAWLANLDARRPDILPILLEVYGRHAAEKWFQRWRIFFMACSELWGYAGGKEWMVSHYRLKKASGGE